VNVALNVVELLETKVSRLRCRWFDVNSYESYTVIMININNMIIVGCHL